MKLILLTAALALGLKVQAQLTFTSMNGITMDMAKTSIEKLTQKKVALKGGSTIGSVEINGSIVSVVFHTYSDGEQYVYQLASTSPRLKTAEGIGIGSSLEDILKAYYTSGYIEIISKEFNEFREKEADKSVYIYSKRSDDDGYYNYINFCLKRNSVFKIVIGRTED